jgi:Tol biopolymer transport system component
VALPNTASVTISSEALTGAAGVPSASKRAATSRVERRSPTATASSTERGGASPSRQMPFAMRAKSPVMASIWARTAACLSSGSRSRQVSRWRVRSLAMSESMPTWSPDSARLMVSSSRSVIFAIAETTMATGRRARCSAERRAATRMRSAEPTLVPPNFMMRMLSI